MTMAPEAHTLTIDTIGLMGEALEGLMATFRLVPKRNSDIVRSGSVDLDESTLIFGTLIAGPTNSDGEAEIELVSTVGLKRASEYLVLLEKGSDKATLRFSMPQEDARLSEIVQTSREADRMTTIGQDLTAHEADPNAHHTPPAVPPSVSEGVVDAKIEAHRANPASHHARYTNTEARAQADAAVTAHEAESDPHSQYLEQNEVDGRVDGRIDDSTLPEVSSAASRDNAASQRAVVEGLNARIDDSSDVLTRQTPSTSKSPSASKVSEFVESEVAGHTHTESQITDLHVPQPAENDPVNTSSVNRGTRTGFFALEDHDHGVGDTEDAINAHRGDSDAHHAKYTDSEARAQASTLITAHKGEADPHPGFATDSDLLALNNRITAVEANEGLDQDEVDARIAPYARATPSGQIADAQIPPEIARDSEIPDISGKADQSDLTDHENNDPHFAHPHAPAPHSHVESQITDLNHRDAVAREAILRHEAEDSHYSESQIEGFIADWAEEGNNDPIPSEKLTNASVDVSGLATNAELTAHETGDPHFSQSQIEGFIAADVADWAEDGNNDPIPASKLTNAPQGGSGTAPDGSFTYRSLGAGPTLNLTSTESMLLFEFIEGSDISPMYVRVEGIPSGATTYEVGQSGANSPRVDLARTGNRVTMSAGANYNSVAVYSVKSRGERGPEGVGGIDGVNGDDGRDAYQGVWTASTSYRVGDIVTRSSSDSTLYSCLTANSDAIFAPAKWQSLRGEDGDDGEGVSIDDNSIEPIKLKANSGAEKKAQRARVSASSFGAGSTLPPVAEMNEGDARIIDVLSATGLSFVDASDPSQTLTTASLGDIMVVLEQARGGNTWTRLGNVVTSPAEVRSRLDAIEADLEHKVVVSSVATADTLGNLAIDLDGRGLFTTEEVTHPAVAPTWDDTPYAHANFIGVRESTPDPEQYNVGQWFANPVYLKPRVVVQARGHKDWSTTSWGAVGINPFIGGAQRKIEMNNRVTANGQYWLNTNALVLNVTSNFVAGTPGSDPTYEAHHYALAESVSEVNEEIENLDRITGSHGEQLNDIEDRLLNVHFDIEVDTLPLQPLPNFVYLTRNHFTPATEQFFSGIPGKSAVRGVGDYYGWSRASVADNPPALNRVGQNIDNVLPSASGLYAVYKRGNFVFVILRADKGTPDFLHLDATQIAVPTPHSIVPLTGSSRDLTIGGTAYKEYSGTPSATLRADSVWQNAFGNSRPIQFSIIFGTGARAQYLKHDGLKESPIVTPVGYYEGSSGSWTRWYPKTNNSNVQALVSSAAITMNVDAGEVGTVTLAHNATFNLTGGSDGDSAMLRVTQDSSGSRTLTLNSAILRGGRDAPTLSTTAANLDLLMFHKVGSVWHYVGAVLHG